MSNQEYKVLPGTVNKGERYESAFVAHVALELALNDDVKDFLISANNEKFHPFDDVVLEIENADGVQKNIALQLKHGDKLLTVKSLTKKTGEFSIQKYVESIKKLKKKIKSSRPEELDNFIWVLYTNRKYSYETNNFKFENPNFGVEMLQCESDSILKSCSKSGCSYKFQILKEASTEFTNSLENFFLYVSQSNVDQMEKELLRRFRDKFNCDENVFIKFLNFIIEWNSKKGVRKKLNKSWIKQFIAIQLLSPLVQPFSKSSVIDEKSDIFRQSINNFDIVVFDKRFYTKVSQLWNIEAKFQGIDMRKVNEMNHKFHVIYAQNLNNLTDAECSKMLWLLDKCPLIIKYSDNIKEVIQLSEKKKFILLYRKLPNGVLNSFENMSLFQNLFDLRKHPSYYEKLTKTFRCSLQGKAQITLEKLLSESEEFQKCISANDLLLFLHADLVIGEENDNLDIYIPRSFSKPVIKETFLETTNKNTIIIIDCLTETSRYNQRFNVKHIENILNPDGIPKDHTNLFKNNKKTIYVSKNCCNRQQIEALCKKLEDEDKEPKNFHHFRIFGQSEIEWVCSSAHIQELREFLVEDYFTKEEELGNNDCNNIIILCGDAGLGKTTSMRKLKKSAFPTFWTVLLCPKDHSHCFKVIKGDISQFENYLLDEAKKKYHSLDLKVFKFLLKTGRVNYIWDGLDEVSEENLPEVLSIIEMVFMKGLKQCLNSRNNLRKSLEDRFSVLANTIKQFDDEEQKCFIRRRLNCGDQELEKLFSKIQNQICCFKYNEILSIPLHIFMFTELLLQDLGKYRPILNNVFSLTDLYKHFVDVKFSIYFKQKENVNDNDFLTKRSNNYKEKRIDQYQIVALKLYFPDYSFKANGICEEFLPEVKIKDVIGIITSVSSDNNVNFLHNSYGEYFAALYFSRNYQNIQKLQFLFKEKYKNIRFMFDLILAEGCPVHIATLYKNIELLKVNDLTQARDRGGRNALQIACSWGEAYPTLQVEKVIKSKWLKNKHTYKVYGMKRKLIQKENSGYKAILEYLLRYCDPEEKDQVYKFSALSYADETSNILAIAAILKSRVNEHVNLKCFKNIPSLLCYSAAFDFAAIFDHVDKIPKVSTENDDSILSLAAMHGSFSSCRKIFSKSGSGDFDVNTSLLRACENGHVNIAELLIEVGADVNIPDRYGRTPLYGACRYGHVEVAKFLIQHGADVNTAQKDGWTPLYRACWNGHADVAKLLIEAGVDVNMAHKDDWIPLYRACRNGLCEVARWLIEAGADVNIANKFGETPLHGACREGHTEVVRLLITAGSVVNKADVVGRTPLSVACLCGCSDVAVFLVKAGADVNIVNAFGETPLYEACLNGHVDVAKLLIEVGADVNVSNKYGETPLYAASRKGHFSVVKLFADVGSGNIRGKGIHMSS